MAAPLCRSIPKARLRRLPTSSSRPRCIASYSHAKAQVQSISRETRTAAASSPSLPSPTYFEATGPVWMPLSGSQEPVDPNKAKLGKSMFLPCFPHSRITTSMRSSQTRYRNQKLTVGKTTALRILQDRMPTLLQSPLPQHILAPSISLQLFPSTHPHLPTVSGRV
ncbi:hypothetical protein LLEC1_06216, partial [Akanthomyces lecanii]